MANSEESSPHTPGSDAPAPAEAPPQGRRRAIIYAGVSVLMFTCALVASWQVQRHFAVDPEMPESPETQASLRLKTDGASTALEALERGDAALVRYRFSVALGHYSDLLARDPSQSALIDYRVGLCHEALGQLELAQAAHRRAAAGAIPALKIAAHLGIARCLLRTGHGTEARRVLYPFLHDETRLQGMPPALHTGIRYVIALAFAAEAAPRTPARPLEDRPLSFLDASLEVPFLLDEIAPLLKPAAKPAATPVSLILKKSKDRRETSVEDVNLEEAPALKIIDRLASEAGWRTQWSEAAKHQLAERVLRLCVHDGSLTALLEQAADRFDLTCAFAGDDVQFSTRTEADAKGLPPADDETVKRALLAALAADESHPWRAAVLLELGNAEARQGSSKKAAQWFDRVIRKASFSPQCTPALYNLALLHLRDQQTGAARLALFRMVDQAPGQELALRAYGRLARMELEDTNAADAILLLRRALPLARNSEWRGVNTLLLAAAYLQQGDPDSARQALAKERAALRKPPCKGMAAFLDAYAKFRAAKANQGGQREAGAVLSALWAEPEITLLGPVGSLLMAQALQDLGFPAQAEQQLQQALRDAGGPVVPTLRYALAEALLAQNRAKEALPILNELAGALSGPWVKAHYRLAQIDLQNRRFPACVKKCKVLWAQRAGLDQTALLTLWGEALEGIGEFSKAAQCFAGAPPE